MEEKIKLILKAVLLLTPLIFLSFIHFQVSFFHQTFFHQVIYFLNLFGIEFQAQGYQIATSNFSSIITFDCTGWKQFYIFCALIFLPLGIKLSNRLKGLLFLIPLYFYNLFRVALTIYLMTFLSYSSFRLIHYFLWDFLFLALIFVFWFWWYLNVNGKVELKNRKKIVKRHGKQKTKSCKR